MKRNENYLYRELAGSMVVIPVGPAAVKSRGMITMNETDRFLWELLAAEQTEESLTAALCAAYDGTTQQAAADVSAFVNQLKRAGALEV